VVRSLRPNFRRAALGIEVSDRTVGRILDDADLQPHRQRMYLTSQDDEFREKRDDVLRVYYEAPASEHIICVDEKTSIQFEYIRHGTLTWMGAFDVRRGKPFGFPSDGHDTDEVNEWLDEHPRWTRHFTPKHASWLNQIECWFSILDRRVLTRGSFISTDDLAAKIDAYVAWHIKFGEPLMRRNRSAGVFAEAGRRGFYPHPPAPSPGGRRGGEGEPLGPKVRFQRGKWPRGADSRA
jgi:hypothetical protein